MNNKNKESFQHSSNLINNYEYEIIGDYINSKSKIEILHKICGNIIEQTPNSHLRGRRCFHCHGIKKLNKLITQEKSNKIHNNEYEIIGEVDGCDKSIKIKHKMCNNIFETTPLCHFRTKCPYCSKNKQDTKTSFIEKSKKIHGNDYEIVGEYVNSSTKIEILHKICNLTFKQKPNDHLSGVCCPNCAKNKKLTKIEILNRVCNIFGDEYSITSDIDSVVSSDYITVIHNKCGVSSTKKLYSFLNGHGCNSCKESIGERIIKRILIKKRIDFKREYKFDDCKHINKLPFDFYLPNYNLCIEFNGIQHYGPVDFFGGDDSFKKRILMDKIKSEYCENNNILLLTISYKENIEFKINYFLESFNCM